MNIRLHIIKEKINKIYKGCIGTLFYWHNVNLYHVMTQIWLIAIISCHRITLSKIRKMIAMFTNEMNYADLGVRLKKYRISRHLTQEQLAELIDTVPSTISHIERGTTKCSLPNLIKICNVLQISLDQAVSDSLYVSQINVVDNDIHELLRDCNMQEKKIIREVVKSIKSALRKNLH